MIDGLCVLGLINLINFITCVQFLLVKRYKKYLRLSNQTIIMKRLLLLALFLSFAITVKAQPPARILFNSSFEEPVIVFPGDGSSGSGGFYDIVDQSLVVGWDVETETVVEIWRNYFNDVRAQEGVQHVELNAFNPSNVFVSVCLLSGETVRLTFAHRAREGNGASPASSKIDVLEIASFNLADPTNNNIVLVDNTSISATNVSDAMSTAWVGSGTTNTVTSNSFRANSPTFGWTEYSCLITNTGVSGPCRIRFRGIGGGSFGNFIDNVRIGGLNPLTEFSSATYSDIEGTGGNQPVIIINGRVDPPLPGDPPSTVQIQLSNGTATNPADYNLAAAFAAADPAIYSYNAGTGRLTVTIAPGDYNGTAAQGIPIPLGIFNDNIPEANETIALELVVPSETGNIRINDANCDNTPVLDATYTIIDDDIVLPVTFTEWKLDDTECGIVKLNWVTAQELNSNYFEVQFSEEGKEWKSIHKVTAKGTSNRTNEYSFIHKTDFKSGYYRLKQVDFDGQFILTHVISSTQDCDKESNYFKFYPNPKSSNQDLTLEFYSVSSTLNYTIIDALGRKVKSNSISTTTNQFIKQDISENLSKGLYLIKFWQNGQEVYQTKLIVR